MANSNVLSQKSGKSDCQTQVRQTIKILMIASLGYIFHLFVFQLEEFFRTPQEERSTPGRPPRNNNPIVFILHLSVFQLEVFFRTPQEERSTPGRPPRNNNPIVFILHLSVFQLEVFFRTPQEERSTPGRPPRNNNPIVFILHLSVFQLEVFFRTPQEERSTPGRPPRNNNPIVFILGDLQHSTMYYFCVSATNQAGNSANSEVVNCMTLEPRMARVPGKYCTGELAKY